MNAGHRAKGQTPPGRPLGAGIVVCALCGKRTRPAARKAPHEGDEECLAQQVINEYESRGWVQAFNVTQSQIIIEAGVPFEWALGGLHGEAVNVFDEFGRGKSINKMVRHKVGFCPKPVMRVALLMTKISFPAELRRKAIRTLWEQEGALDALEAMGRLDGNVGMAIRELLR